MATILGIESSCDETAAAVVRDHTTVLSSVVASQIETHAPYGGVVPELAARDHVNRIDQVIDDALAAADVELSELDAVAATVGPGLAGALLIGMAAAKAISLCADVPFVGVNHLDAHAHAAAIDTGFEPPGVALIVSGGHTLLAEVGADWTFDLLGETVDDAAGEAFDKVARTLGLGYPGGPVVDRLSLGGDPETFRLPRAMLRDGFDFSFSGLKTAVYQICKRAERDGVLIDEADLAASFQAAVVDVLAIKTLRAADEVGARSVVVGGGVAANSELRARLGVDCDEAGLELHIPSITLCADNAAMVASAADRRVAAGDFDPLDMCVEPSLRIGALPAPPGV